MSHLALAVTSLVSAALHQPERGFEVAVRGLKTASGQLVVALCTAREYQIEDCRRTKKVAPSVPSTSVSFSDAPSEPFAVIVYHDRNDNGRLDVGAFGFPAEGLGFSGDPLLLRKPDFKAISVKPDASASVAVTLRFEPGS